MSGGPKALAAGVPRRRFALVLWSAEIGGAETLMLALAQRVQRFDADAEIVIVGRDGPLVDRLRATDTRYRTLGFGRGREVLRRPRRLAQAVADSGPDGALIVECGYLGACLRAGGYHAPIVAMEHGIILLPRDSLAGRTIDRISRAAGAWANDAEVAVSDLVLARMRRQPHARRLRRIYNGIDPEAFAPAPLFPGASPSARGLVVGFVGRLVPGKGLDILIQAVAKASEQVAISLLVAGDGPERDRLIGLTQDVGAAACVRFLGMIADVVDFWRRCDVAIVPSNSFIESFCLAAVEASACGKPLIATNNGALPEVVLDGATGKLVPPGDVDAIFRAIISYARHPSLVTEHSQAARAWAVERFHVDDCARAYLGLFAEIDRAAS